jgi:hypothetical protein
VGSSAIFNTARALQTAMVDGDFIQHKGSDLCMVFNIFDTICKIKNNTNTLKMLQIKKEIKILNT